MLKSKLKVGLASLVNASFCGSSENLYRTRYLPEMESLAKKLDFELVGWKDDVTNDKDAAKVCDLFNKEEVDFILLQCTTFPFGTVILPFANTRAPLGLWAIGESSDRGPLPLNSFCGVNMLMSILGQYMDSKRKVKWFYGETEDPLFLLRFKTTLGAMRGIKRLRGSRVGLIGGIAPGFTDLSFDERTTMSRLGVSVDRLPEYGDIKERALAYKQEELAPVVGEFASSASCVSCQSDLETTARLYKAIEDFVAEGDYDGVAIGCWPKYRRDFGAVVCSIIGRLLEKGVIAACEGDVDGMVSMMLLQGVAPVKSVPMLMDLSDLDFNDNSVMFWHCGSGPSSFADSAGMSLGSHFKPGKKAAGGDATPVGAINDMYFRSVPATVARFTWEYSHMLLMTGEFFDKPGNRGFDGSRGWMKDISIAGKPAGAADMMNTLLVNRLQHHYAIIPGNYQNEVMEVMAWLDIAPVELVRHEPYLQTFGR